MSRSFRAPALMHLQSKGGDKHELKSIKTATLTSVFEDGVYDARRPPLPLYQPHVHSLNHKTSSALGGGRSRSKSRGIYWV